MGGGAPLESKSITIADNGTDPLAAFRGDRGFGRVPADRLRELRRRYAAWFAQTDAERRVWPRPVAAAYYCQAILEELDTELAAREGGQAA